uniref:Response regulatory domain-containing protein n=1 Tax=Leersia perrieri TaxID=77586 RepID=A0A0D9WG74_9ORYZ
MAENGLVPPGRVLPAAGFLGRLHVLVVDDDAACLEDLKLLLLLAGYSVTGKTTAEEALQEVERNSEGYFDVVMTDVHMPGMDGFDLLRGVRGRFPVIMFSDAEDVLTMMRAVMDGACDYMVKPVTSQAIKSIWMHVMRRRLSVTHPQPSPLPDNRFAPPALPAGISRGDGQVAALLPQPPAPAPAPVGNTGSDVQEAALAQLLAPAENGRGDVQEAAKAAVVAVAGSSRRGGHGKRASKKRGSPVVLSDESSNNCEPTGKKARARFNWNRASHSVFFDAYNQLKDEASPKRIKELMEREGIFVTVAQVSSHLQKFRRWLETASNQEEAVRSPNNILSKSQDTRHYQWSRQSIISEGPLAGMVSSRPVHPMAASKSHLTVQSNYVGLGCTQIEDFISNHRRSEETRQPIEQSQSCATNYLRVINDSNHMTHEMSAPRAAPAPLGYDNNVDWPEFGSLDDLQDNDMLMNSLLNGHLQQDDENQEMLHVLVVDDDAACLEELKLLLLLAGYSVTGKTTAEEALQEVERNSEGYFDVVMTNVHMPGMDGFDLLRGVRGRFPVIMFSEGDDVLTMMRAVMDGACDYMVKPVTSGAIKSIWMHVMRRRLSATHPQVSPLPDNRLARPALPAGSSRGDGQVAALLPQPLAPALAPAPAGNTGGDVQEAALAQPLAPAENRRGDVREAAVAVAESSHRGGHGKRASKKRGAPVVLSDESSNNCEPTGKKAWARFNWNTVSHSVFFDAYNQLKDEAIRSPNNILSKSQHTGHYQWKRQSVITEGPLAGMVSSRPVHPMAASKSHLTVQSNYVGLGCTQIENFISNHRRSEENKQPMEQNQSCATNYLRVINDSNHMTHEISAPRTAPAPLGYDNNVDWPEFGSLDDLQDNDMLMNSLLNGHLQQDDENQEM